MRWVRLLKQGNISLRDKAKVHTNVILQQVKTNQDNQMFLTDQSKELQT